MAHGYHADLTGENIHVPYAWSYADTAAREWATGFAAGDVGKLALQEDDNSLWILTDDDPLTWVAVSVPAAEATETAAKADYTAGDLDTEAEIIEAINATNETLNSLITKLVALGLLEPEPEA